MEFQPRGWRHYFVRTGSRWYLAPKQLNCSLGYLNQAATVLIGTLYPLILDVLNAGKVSVGPPFFNATFVPLMVPLVAVMVVGPLLSWKRADLAGALARLGFAAALTVLVVLFAQWLRGGQFSLALAGIGLAAWALFGALAEWTNRVGLFRLPLTESLARGRALPRAAWGMTLAHAGLGVAIAGMVGTSAWVDERILTVRPGDVIQLSGYSLSFERVDEIAGPNYSARRGHFTIRRDGVVVGSLDPEQRHYTVTGMELTHAAIRTSVTDDLYLALGGDDDGSGAWTLRAYHHPLVPWLWFGGLLMVAGGVLSLSDRRLRVGVPAVRPRLAAGT